MIEITTIKVTEAVYIDASFALHAAWESHNNPQWYGEKWEEIRENRSEMQERYESPFDSMMFDLAIAERRESPYID